MKSVILTFWNLDGDNTDAGSCIYLHPLQVEILNDIKYKLTIALIYDRYASSGKRISVIHFK